MIDPRQHVSPGQRLRLAAEQVNSLNRMMRASHGGQMVSGGLGAADPARNIIYCKNDSGSDVGRWAVLEIGGVVIDPATDADHAESFQATPVVLGVEPTDPAKPFVIAVEPIADGAIGRVAASGVVPVKLDVTAEADTTAASKAGSTGELKTGSGPAAVLWKESGTGGGKWGLVRFGGGGGGKQPRLGTISATWTKGATATVTQIKADGAALSPTVTFTATNWFATVTTDGGTKKVLCVFVEDRWLLAAAECE